MRSSSKDVASRLPLSTRITSAPASSRRGKSVRRHASVNSARLYKTSKMLNRGRGGRSRNRDSRAWKNAFNADCASLDAIALRSNTSPVLVRTFISERKDKNTPHAKAQRAQRKTKDQMLSF